MLPLRSLKDKDENKIVTSPSAVESAVLKNCMVFANLHDDSDDRPGLYEGESFLLFAYRSLAPTTRKARSDEEDERAARALGAQLRQVLAEFQKSPREFRAAFRRLGPEGLKERRKRFDGVRPYARYWLKGNGEVFLSYVVEFATDDALVEYCQALLTDPRFDADQVRRCLRDSCQRFFWRAGKRIYCSDKCTDKEDQKLAVERVRAYREREKGKTGEEAQMRAATYSRYSTAGSASSRSRISSASAMRSPSGTASRSSPGSVTRRCQGGTSCAARLPGDAGGCPAREFDAIVAEDASEIVAQHGRAAPAARRACRPRRRRRHARSRTRQEAGGMMGAVLGAGAEQYRREIGRKSRRGREGNALKGKWTGGRAYGYRARRRRDVDRPAGGRDRREIFQRYADGESPLAIAADLNARRIPSPGSTWKRELRRRGGWVMSGNRRRSEARRRYLELRPVPGPRRVGSQQWIRGVADSKKRRQVRCRHPNGSCARMSGCGSSRRSCGKP